jgi:hypothetical protein
MSQTVVVIGLALFMTLGLIARFTIGCDDE